MVYQCLKIKTGYFILHFHSFYQISDAYIAEWLIFELKAGVNSRKRNRENQDDSLCSFLIIMKSFRIDK